MIVICNPVAGGGRGLAAGRAVSQLLHRRELPCELALTEAPGHATELARRAIARGIAHIAVAGGDGTLHEVVQGVVVAGVAQATIVFVGGGTSCDFAKRLGPARKDRLLSNEVRSYDLIRIEFESGAARYAVNGSSVGVLAEATLAYDRRRRVVGLARRLSTDAGMVAAGVAAMVRHSPHCVHVARDGRAPRTSVVSGLALMKTAWLVAASPPG